MLSRVALWSLAAVTAIPVMALTSRPALAAGARPSFEMPFDCNTTWSATTYDTGSGNGTSWDHRNYLDFGQAGAALKTVRASAAGFARLTDAGEGKVTVNHGNGWTTVYQHMTNITVNASGRDVAQGFALGIIGQGQVGTSTGPHLHYGQLADGQAQEAVFRTGTYSWTPGQTTSSGGFTFTNDRSSTNTLTSGNCGVPFLSTNGDPSVTGAVVQDGAVTWRFPLRNTGSASFTTSQMVVRMEAATGQAVDAPCAGGTNLSIAAGASYVCNAAAVFPALGNYRVYLRWRTASGAWSDGDPFWSGIWGWTAFPVNDGPLGAAIHANGLQARVGGGTQLAWEVWNQSGRTLTFPDVQVALTLPNGVSFPVYCTSGQPTGGGPVTLAAGAVQNCVGFEWPFVVSGVHRIEVRYQRPDGSWFAGSPPAAQSFNVVVPADLELRDIVVDADPTLGGSAHIEFTVANIGPVAARFYGTASAVPAGITQLADCAWPAVPVLGIPLTTLQPGETFRCVMDTTFTGPGTVTVRVAALDVGLGPEPDFQGPDMFADDPPLATFTVPPAPNLPPRADDSPDLTVDSATGFVLAGGGYDPEGEPVQFHWEQISGPPAVLRDEDTATATVEGISGPATLVFRLTVTDPSGQTDTDEVIVTVRARPK